METDAPKYQKLASEYAKLRAQASVLKRALLEEQTKDAQIRDQLRQRESALRRAEQEVDSLSFRNKQMEQRVAALQEEIAINEGRNSKREPKQKNKSGGGGKATPQVGMMAVGNEDLAQDALIFEELQKKIMENAQLTSSLDDKERSLQMHAERILSLEQTLEQRSNDNSNLEQRLRRELETLQCKNSELETKLVEAASMLGSEDALSAAGSDNTPLHNTLHNHGVVPATFSAEERCACLEKDVAHWRTQYEIVKLNTTFANNSSKQQTAAAAATETNTIQSDDANCSCSSTAAGIAVKPSYAESKSAQRARESLRDPPEPPTKEQLLYNNFSQKYEDLLRAKYVAESRVNTFELEAEHLQCCLENATQTLKAKDEQMLNLNRAIQMLEEDLATTRINYEEQISVLTEQVISLSEQLAACK